MKRSELRQIIKEEIKKLKEGLEGHVDTVIDKNAPHLSDSYYWSNGLNVKDKKDAEEIINVLDGSGEFSPATYKNGKIVFGESLREEESDAAAQAEKLGLIYKGYGRWADPKTNKIVAVSKDGKLYKAPEGNRTEEPADKKSEEPEKTEPAKPSYAKPTPGKKTPDDADILIPGFGVVKHSLAKKELAKKIEDLTKRAAEGKFSTLGKGNFDTLAAWWDTLAQHSGEKQ